MGRLDRQHGFGAALQCGLSERLLPVSSPQHRLRSARAAAFRHSNASEGRMVRVRIGDAA
jgi:hypothetical protein